MLKLDCLAPTPAEQSTCRKPKRSSWQCNAQTQHPALSPSSLSLPNLSRGSTAGPERACCGSAELGQILMTLIGSLVPAVLKKEAKHHLATCVSIQSFQPSRARQNCLMVQSRQPQKPCPPTYFHLSHANSPQRQKLMDTCCRSASSDPIGAL